MNMDRRMGPKGPGYNEFRPMKDVRGPLGEAFANQILTTTRAFRKVSDEDTEVLDVGCGYGDTAVQLARRCRSVVGLEPAIDLYREARQKLSSDLPNLEFRNCGVEQIAGDERFDLIVLDNVFEHLPEQEAALRALAGALRPGGVMYLLTPNKLWPIEAHYHLPFLSYLPLRWANAYLRMSGRGHDYTDASYAPTYWSLVDALSTMKEMDWSFVLPGATNGTVAGSPLHYRLGMAAIERYPRLWAVSKAFLVVAVKQGSDQ